MSDQPAVTVEELATSLDEAADQLEKAIETLEAWEDMGRRLWPHVRLFGICGASLEAVKAVEDLYCLLSSESQGSVPQPVAEIEQQIKVSICRELADWFVDFPASRGMLATNRERIADAIRQWPIKGGVE